MSLLGWIKEKLLPTGHDEIFDPYVSTVAEIRQYLASNPDDEARVIAEERKGRNRKSIVGR